MYGRAAAINFQLTDLGMHTESTRAVLKDRTILHPFAEGSFHIARKPGAPSLQGVQDDRQQRVRSLLLPKIYT